MKLHHTVVNHLISLVANYSGHKDEHKLREVISTLDLTVYTQNKDQADKNLQKEVIVLTKELMKEIKGIK